MGLYRGLNGVPTKIHVHPELQNVTLFRNRSVADISSQGSGDEDHPAFRVGPKSNDLCPYKKRRGHTDMGKKEGHVTMEAETRARRLQAKEPPEDGEKARILPYRVQMEHGPSDTLTWTPSFQNCGKINSAVLSHLICGH